MPRLGFPLKLNFKHTAGRPLGLSNTEPRRVRGLAAHVDVVVDRWGVPHIYAASPLDACYAQGYVHGTERLFQMELSRRAPQGRLSEVFGRRALEVDRYMRRLGLHRAAEEELRILPDDARTVFDAYAAGVNAGAGDAGKPLEYRLLRFDFEPWTVFDSLCFGRMMALNLSGNWEAELARAELVAELGVERAVGVEPLVRAEDPVVVGGVQAALPAVEALIDEFGRVAEALHLGGGASNAWVADGSRTRSGRPLLANDPHLAVQLPSTWFECELEAPGLHVTGATLPGLPGVMIGHNDDIAWGITASMADVQDVAVVPSETAARASHLPERIRVRGASPVIEDVAVIDEGPIIERQADGRALAMRATFLEPRPMATGVLALMQARDVASAREALRAHVAPALCYTLADRHGGIGFQVAGLIPRRRSGGGFLPWPAGDDRFGWDGFVPYDDLPHRDGAPDGVLFTANNQIEAGPALTVPGEFADGYRARRIEQLLAGRAQLEAADFWQMQGDVYALHAEMLLAAIADWEPSDLALKAALGRLRTWDRRMLVTSRDAAVFEAFLLRLMWNVLRARIGRFAELYLGRPSKGLGRSAPLCWRVTSLALSAIERDGGWFAAGEREKLLNRSLREALNELARKLGPEPRRWRWGRLHRVQFRHALSALPMLGKVFDRGDIPVPGDMHTVWQTAYLTYEPYEVKAWTASYRQVIDVGNWENSWAMHAPGQSGRPGNTHYADRIEGWAGVRYHPMTFSRAAAEANAERTIKLEPA